MCIIEVSEEEWEELVSTVKEEKNGGKVNVLVSLGVSAVSGGLTVLTFCTNWSRKISTECQWDPMELLSCSNVNTFRQIKKRESRTRNPKGC